VEIDVTQLEEGQTERSKEMEIEFQNQ
jgi:hypothetical protein